MGNKDRRQAAEQETIMKGHYVADRRITTLLTARHKMPTNFYTMPPGSGKMLAAIYAMPANFLVLQTELGVMLITCTKMPADCSAMLAD